MPDIPTIRLAYADDHVLVRKGLISLLSHYSNIIVEIEANNGQDLLKQLESADHLPDICIVDVNMPVMNGFDTLSAIKENWPELPVLVFTVYETDAYILRMIVNGASGYLMKNCTLDEVYEAIEAVYKHGFYYSELVTRQYINAVRNKHIKFPNITDQELAVLKKCCSDLSYAEIAKKLGTTTRSVEGCRDSLFRKLHVNSRVSLALYAVETGLVPIEKAITDAAKVFKS